MKGKLLLIAFIVLSISSYAQTWNEWFHQKKTQIQYLTQQIGGLQIYAESLGKGYKIARTGLQSIGDIKNGELNLHKAFVSSLSKINLVIGKDFRISAVVALQASISEQYRKCLDMAVTGGMITAGELRYVHSVFDNLLDNCGTDIDDLIAVTTDDQLHLSDDERLKRIEVIYQSMKDKQQFAVSFCGEVNALIVSRRKTQQEVSSTKKLFDLK